jgi:hypothetical protein
MRLEQSLSSYLPSTVVTELERSHVHGSGQIVAASLPIRQKLPHGKEISEFGLQL